MTNNLRDIEALCHDIDGVLYPHDSVPDLYEAWVHAHAQAAVHVLGEDTLTLEEARAIGRKGWEKDRDSVSAFTKCAEDRGLKGSEFRDAYFPRVHIIARRHFQATSPHIFAPDHDMVDAYDALSAHIKNGVATHGHAEEWAVPLLKGRGIFRYFQEDAIFGLNHGGYRNKDADSVLVEKCLAALKRPPEVSGYIEDSPKNIERAKEKMPRLTCIYIHNGSPLARLPTCINFQFSNLTEMKRAIFRSRQEDSPRIFIL